MWYTLYPDMNGIFFDEGCNDCGPDNVFSKLYQTITQNTKDLYPGAITVQNPGATMPQCFEQSAETLVTSEGRYETIPLPTCPTTGILPILASSGISSIMCPTARVLQLSPWPSNVVPPLSKSRMVLLIIPTTPWLTMPTCNRSGHERRRRW